jgi:hypothetical protein
VKYYMVESEWGWFVVKAKTRRLAKTEGVNEWGRGTVVRVREATDAEAKSYELQKGAIEEIR